MKKILLFSTAFIALAAAPALAEVGINSSVDSNTAVQSGANSNRRIGIDDSTGVGIGTSETNPNSTERTVNDRFGNDMRSESTIDATAAQNARASTTSSTNANRAAGIDPNIDNRNVSGNVGVGAGVVSNGSATEVVGSRNAATTSTVGGTTTQSGRDGGVSDGFAPNSRPSDSSVRAGNAGSGAGVSRSTASGTAAGSGTMSNGGSVSGGASGNVGSGAGVAAGASGRAGSTGGSR